EINYDWDEAAKLVHLNVKQTQTVDDITPIYRMPVEVEIVTPSGARSHRIQVIGKEQDYYLEAETRPLSVRFDKGGAIIKKLKFNRPLEQISYQLEHAADIWGRVEAAQDLKNFPNDEAVVKLLAQALSKDQFWGVRKVAANSLGTLKTISARDALIAAFNDS